MGTIRLSDDEVYLQSKTEIDCISGNKTMKAYWWRWLMIRLTIIKWAILDFLAGR
jgi:hypothetical protein